MEPILTILINNGIGVGCAAVVLWLLWYQVTKTIPLILKTMLEQRIRSEDQHIKSLETFSTLVREERANYQRWHEENRDRLDNIPVEMKEVRHMVKDLANQMGTRHALEDQREKKKEEQQQGNPKGG